MKKTNNKGFSLVELIVVVAIMAVLMVVVAPQMLRYVERTRLQKDNSAIGEIVNAVKIAMADETINTSVGASKDITFAGGANSAKTVTFSGGADGSLEKELENMFGASFTTSSNSYRDSATALKIEITNTSGTVTVKVEGWIDAVGSAPLANGSEKVL